MRLSFPHPLLVRSGHVESTGDCDPLTFILCFVPQFVFAPENMVWRDGFGSPVPRQPAHVCTQAASSAYLLRDSSRVPQWRPLIYLIPPYAIESVPSLSGHAIAYRWRSLPRVRRHRASKHRGNPERVLPWQVTMDQLMCASSSHTHYWY